MFKALMNRFSIWIGRVNWKTEKVLTAGELATINGLLQKNYYIILTRHNGALASYAIAIAHFFLTGRWGYYGHVLMNLENDVLRDSDFRFVEATAPGVHYSNFNQVFEQQCSSVALLKPVSMTLDEWTGVLDKAKVYLGRPYDTLFDLTSDKALSCVEVVRNALKGEPNYDEDFIEFEKMIARNKNLDPQMFLECSDFEVVYEVRH